LHQGALRPLDRMCTHDRTLCLSGRATAAVATLRNSRREASGVMIVPTAKVLNQTARDKRMQVFDPPSLLETVHPS
jgi:hypothetical protein